MKNIRIIPRIDIKGPSIVKGIHLEGLRVLGRPQDFARFYNQEGADEIIYMDVVASLYNRNNLRDIITKTANEIDIPLTVGGGLRTIKDIKEVLRAGADKVSINTAAVTNPKLVRDAALEFGSSTIVVAIEAIKHEGEYYAFTDNGREFTGLKVVEWALRIEEMGAGEICLTSVDNEGTGNGFDIDLINEVNNKIKIPLIAHGGGGKNSDILKVINEANADGVVIASMFHYNAVKQSISQIEDIEEGNIEFLKKNKMRANISETSIVDLKKYLLSKGINLRL